MQTLSIRVTHQKADASTLKAFAFPDAKKALKEIVLMPTVEECVIIQTRNRVEIFAAAVYSDLPYHDIMDYVMEQSLLKLKEYSHPTTGTPQEERIEHIIMSSKKLHDVIEVEFHSDALQHILRLACGMESLSGDENQILWDVRDAYDSACRANAVGSFFKIILSKAIQVGRRVRQETEADKSVLKIEKELLVLEKRLYCVNVKAVLTSLFGNMEGIRRRDLERAIRMLGNGIKDMEKKIIDALTRGLLIQILFPVIQGINRAADVGDEETINIAEKFFCQSQRNGWVKNGFIIGVRPAPIFTAFSSPSTPPRILQGKGKLELRTKNLKG